MDICHCLCFRQLSGVAEDGSTLVFHCQLCERNACLVTLWAFSKGEGTGDPREHVGHEQGGKDKYDGHDDDGGDDEGYDGDDGVWHDMALLGEDDGDVDGDDGGGDGDENDG